jgi:hypothetical protein
MVFMNDRQKKGGLKLGGLMLFIAGLACDMGWSMYVTRRNARTLEAELAKAHAEWKQTIAANEAEAAKEAEMERKADESMAKAQEALERAKQPQPQRPPISSIPGQVGNIVNLLEERQKREAKSRRMNEEIARKIRVRMEQQRLEAEASKATTPPAAPSEQPQ